jgi:hypothetical protein
VLNREVKDLKRNHAAKIQVLDLANQQFQQEHQQVRDCIEHTCTGGVARKHPTACNQVTKT